MYWPHAQTNVYTYIIKIYVNTYHFLCIFILTGFHDDETLVVLLRQNLVFIELMKYNLLMALSWQQKSVTYISILQWSVHKVSNIIAFCVHFMFIYPTENIDPICIYFGFEKKNWKIRTMTQKSSFTYY